MLVFAVRCPAAQRLQGRFLPRYLACIASPFFVCFLLLLGVASPAAAREWTVAPPATIQATVDTAQPGDTIRILPGVYREAVHVDKPHITLSGVIQHGVWPRLEGDGRLNDAVTSSGSGFVVENLAIAHYKGNGVMTQGADDVTIRHLIVDDTGIYGIYPTMGQNVRVEGNVVSGIADAAIYIGMCEHVDVTANEVVASVAGIEIENSLHALIQGNVVRDNAGGILMFTLPGLPKKQTADVVVRRNHVEANNHRNFGAPGSSVAHVPPGSGIIVLAADQVVITDNIIRDHMTAGIVVVDLSVMPGMVKDPAVEPNPDDVTILANLVDGSGTKTPASLFNWYHYIAKSVAAGSITSGTLSDLLPKGVDLYATGHGARNCLASPERYTQGGSATFAVCGAPPAMPATMLAASAAPRDHGELGMATYAAVCSGCHAMDIQRIGPPIKEIRQKYAGNPAGIVAFATSPHKVRDGFPAMPPQAHLGAARLEAVARYLLSTAKL